MATPTLVNATLAEDEWGGGRFAENNFNNGATAAVFLFTQAYAVFRKDSLLL